MINDKNIRAEIARHKKTMGQMAHELGISSNSFRFKLNGKREFTLEEMEKMADMFNCSIDYLACRDTA